MMILLIFACRNLVRNYRRSLVTLLAISFGIAALALFSGYTRAIYNGLSNMAIHSEMLGHISINKPGWDKEGKINPEKFLITPEDIESVSAIIRKNAPQSQIIPRMGLNGLISNGKISTIFFAYGIGAEDLKTLLGSFGSAVRGLDPHMPTGILIADGLAEMVDLDPGAVGAIMVSTINGQANASDVHIVNRMNTARKLTNDTFLLMPLDLAREMKDIGLAAEWLTVLLERRPPSRSLDEGIYAALTQEPMSEAKIAEIRSDIIKDLKNAGFDFEVRFWRELSEYYNQVKQTYDIIFLLMIVIIVVIVALSIANAMSMSVIERTREIGTLRAIGLRRSGVVGLFLTEALLLVAVGVALGLIETQALRWLINGADIRYVPPGNSLAIPVYIAFDGVRILIALLLQSVLVFLAAYLPASRAARQQIVVSLTHT